MKTTLMLCTTAVLFIIKANAQTVDHMQLSGLWKIENKSTYEYWETADSQSLKGKSFKKENGKEKVLETLEIKKEENKVTYYATVPNQNDGRSIPFVLNTSIKDTLTFENFEHDFPNRVQYYPLNKKTIQVLVSGKDGKGFGYKIQKVDE